MGDPRSDSRAADHLLTSLRERGGRALGARTVAERVGILGQIGERIADPDDPLGRSARDEVRIDAGYSGPMADAVVAGMARDWTTDRLDRMVRSDLPDPSVLDHPRSGPGGDEWQATGDGLAVHIASGSVPGVGATSLIRSLVVGTPVLLKPGRGDRALPMAVARGLEEADPELADACAVVYWPGGDGGALESRALDRADRVVVYGSDRTVESIRARLAPGVPLVAYPHRVSVAMLGRDALDRRGPELANHAARAVALFDQRGCVSPHMIWVESDPARVREWAAELAEASARWAGTLPPGELDPDEAARLRQWRASAELDQAMATGTDTAPELHADDGLGWAVWFDPDPTFRASCLGRTVRVAPVSDLCEAIGQLGSRRSVLQSAGLEVASERRGELAGALVRAGVTRVTTLERQPWPPAWWRHDGRGPLEPLIRWSSIER